MTVYTPIACVVEGCTWVSTPKNWARKGMCPSHYAKSVRGTLHYEEPDALIDDDNVQGPGDLPIIPKTSATWDRADGLWAVVMPYPSFDGSQPCAADPGLFDDDSDRDRVPRLAACKSCPFRTSCFEWAMAHEEFGYWAGTYAKGRKKMRAERRQALVTPHLGDLFPDRNWDERIKRDKARAEEITDYPEEDWYADEPVYQQEA